MLQARRFLVTGRVQGVGYRYFVYDRALVEGIGGSVSNLPDGSVEIYAEGDAEAMRRFETAIRQGPSHARVDNVEVDVLPPSARSPMFLIK